MNSWGELHLEKSTFSQVSDVAVAPKKGCFFSASRDRQAKNRGRFWQILMDELQSSKTIHRIHIEPLESHVFSVH